jgi:mediator of RNA polymerase II transcription subunit 23
MRGSSFPVYFDDICVRALPALTLIMYRFIENEAFEAAERLLEKYSMLFIYHPTPFTFVRDTLAYFYGCLPNKFIIRLLSNLDLTKV